MNKPYDSVLPGFTPERNSQVQEEGMLSTISKLMGFGIQTQQNKDHQNQSAGPSSGAQIESKNCSHISQLQNSEKLEDEKGESFFRNNKSYSEKISEDCQEDSEEYRKIESGNMSSVDKELVRPLDHSG